MRRGTTPLHTLTLKTKKGEPLPIDASMVSEIRVIYKQDDEIKIRKGTEDCTLDGNILTLELTREETMLLDASKLVNIQPEIFTNDGKWLVGSIVIKTVGDCLDDEV